MPKGETNEQCFYMLSRCLVGFLWLVVVSQTFLRIPNLVNSVQSGLLAQATQNDVALIWLTDQSKVNDVSM